MNGMLLIAVFLASGGAGSPVSVQATLEPVETPFHKPARYTLVVEAPREVEVILPVLDGVFEGLEIQPGEQTVEQRWGGRVRITQSYVLDPIAIRSYTIPAIEVCWGEGQSATTAPFTFRVRDLTREEKSAALRFAGIVSPSEAVTPRWRRWFRNLAATALLLGAGPFIYLWLRRGGARERDAAPMTSWELAYRRLRHLARRQLPAAGKVGSYYVDLSAILRHYIEDRFDIRAPEQTTPEFLEAASNSGLLAASHQHFLAQFLRRCDRVKFARYRPGRSEMDRAFALVRHFVQATEEEAPAAEEGAAL